MKRHIYYGTEGLGKFGVAVSEEARSGSLVSVGQSRSAVDLAPRFCYLPERAGPSPS